MEVFKKEVEAISGGAVTADLFPAMQLGGAKENVDQVRSGTVFATWIGIAYLSRTVAGARKPSACPSCSPTANRRSR